MLDTVSAVCSYAAHYKDHLKYWCRGYYRDYCSIIAFTPNSTGRVALRDTGEQLIVTVSCLTKEDAGWYWCGIQRDFARDDMDFTELVVTDSRGAHTSDFWSMKGRGMPGVHVGVPLQRWLSEQSGVSRSLDLTPCRVPVMPRCVVRLPDQPSRTQWRLKECQAEMQRQRVGLGTGLAWLLANPFFLMQMRQGTRTEAAGLPNSCTRQITTGEQTRPWTHIRHFQRHSFSTSTRSPQRDHMVPSQRIQFRALGHKMPQPVFI